ncbi:MAG: hypothetical protein U9O55_02910 [Patescibacteria group bacterium]|nr:hypothetical protein [Patescibacteria group bacterium]
MFNFKKIAFCFLLIFAINLFIVNIADAALFDSGSEGRHYFDLMGEYGFERSSTGEPMPLKLFILLVINYILGFLGILFILLIIYGGYYWMFSGGNEQKIATAKKILLNATIGVVIVLLSASITFFVFTALGAID